MNRVRHRNTSTVFHSLLCPFPDSFVRKQMLDGVKGTICLNRVKSRRGACFVIKEILRVGEAIHKGWTGEGGYASRRSSCNFQQSLCRL